MHAACQCERTLCEQTVSETVSLVTRSSRCCIQPLTTNLSGHQRSAKPSHVRAFEARLALCRSRTMRRGSGDYAPLRRLSPFYKLIWVKECSGRTSETDIDPGGRRNLRPTPCAEICSRVAMQHFGHDPDSLRDSIGTLTSHSSQKDRIRIDRRNLSCEILGTPSKRHEKQA